jgi:hypothetical protein
MAHKCEIHTQSNEAVAADVDVAAGHSKPKSTAEHRPSADALCIHLLKQGAFRAGSW